MVHHFHRLVDKVGTAQCPFLFTALVGQNVASAHMVPLELAGSSFLKPFGRTLFGLHFRHNSTALFLNSFAHEIGRLRKRGVFIGEPPPQV